MNDLGAFLGRLVGCLEDARVPYMIAGSVASTYHGVPRTTQDVDFVVELTKPGVSRFLQVLPEEQYYVSESAALDAVRRHSQFNVIDLDTGWKADLIVRKERPFSHIEFSRKQRADVLGVSVWVATAEDTVVTKLEWAHRSGGSERQLRDVAGVLEMGGNDLDHEYIASWCAKLGLSGLLTRAKALE